MSARARENMKVVVSPEGRYLIVQDMTIRIEHIYALHQNGVHVDVRMTNGVSYRLRDVHVAYVRDRLGMKAEIGGPR